MHNKNYISVGIDVGSAFSFMTILAPDETVILKPFKITHNNKDSLERAVSEIKKAEELYSLESRIFLESTGIYHFPLFCYLVDCGFNASIINPIITHSTIFLTLDLVEKLDSALDSILNRIRQLITFNKNEKFIQQIKLLNTIPGVGFLTAVTIMCEIGDFSAFRNPKQLFAYFGLDPEVNESGKFVGTQLHMSKRGSRIARRAIFAVALASIRTKRNGEGINPYLRKYYELKSGQKPKMVAIGAVMHKVCNIVFAVLRDEKAFELRSPEEHCKQYQRPALAAA